MKITLDKPAEEHLALAKEFGLNCQLEFSKYKDWLETYGKKHKNEAAGFRNWLRKAWEFKPYKAADAAIVCNAHQAAKIPELGEHTQMPDKVREQLKQFNGKFKTGVNI